MNIRRKITTAALTGVLLVGGASTAFAGGQGGGGGGEMPPMPPMPPSPYWQLPPWWGGGGGGGWGGGHHRPDGRPDKPAPADPCKRGEMTDQGTMVCKKGCFAQNKRGKWIPVDCPCTERDKKGNLVEVDCPTDKECPKHGDKCAKGGRNKTTKAPVHRGRQHPVTGTAAALYAVGGGLLAATGGTLLATQKRRNNA